MENKEKKEFGSDVNRCEFNLVTNPNASLDEYGFTEDYVYDLLYIANFEPDNECMSDSDVLNNLGIIYNDGLCTDVDMDKAIEYYQKAVDLGDDLAKSNLADIFRKGTNGVPKDLERAFALYQSCRLPYGYYRVGEALEYGYGTEKDIDRAKQYYRIAYREGHPLAKRKLQTLNFLED